MASIKNKYMLAMSYIKKAIEEDSSSNGGVDKWLLDEIESIFTNDLIPFAKQSLIIRETAFYGSLLLQVETCIDYKQSGPTDLVINKTPFMLAINPLHMNGWNFGQFLGAIVSELLAIPFDSPSYYEELNSSENDEQHQMLEKANGAALSSIVQCDIHRESGDGASKMLRIPPNLYTVSQLGNDTDSFAKEKESIPYYYNLLNNNKNKTEGAGQNQRPIPISGQSSDGSGEKAEVSTVSNGKGNDIHKWEKNASDAKDAFKTMVSDALNASNAKERGDLPASILEAINKLLAPPQLKWQTILKNLAGTIPYGKRYTRLRLNRRQPYRPDLRGCFPDRVVEVVCVFDTSGSMSNEDIKYCMNEVFGIFKAQKTVITIVECDSEVNYVYQVKNIKEVHEEVHGRGGTLFSPAIEYINGDNEKFKVPKHRYKNALMVYFTDGYGEYSIPKPDTYKNLWVVLEDEKCLSVDNPYGKVVSIRTDNKFRK